MYWTRRLKASFEQKKKERRLRRRKTTLTWRETESMWRTQRVCERR